MLTYAGYAISWRSKLQECTNPSTTEAEYIVMSKATKEAIWLQRLMVYFLTKSRTFHITLTLHCESQSAIHLGRNPVYQAKTKHIEMRYHHIRELFIDKKLKIQKINTKVNTVDCLTKSLQDYRFRALRGRMGLEQAIKTR